MAQITAYVEELISATLTTPEVKYLSEASKNLIAQKLSGRLNTLILDSVIDTLEVSELLEIKELSLLSPRMRIKLEEFSKKRLILDDLMLRLSLEIEAIRINPALLT